MTASLTVAATLDEATQALGDGARIVAGGTDLVVGARQGKAPLPENLVAIHRLDELRRIDSDETLTLGALVTHAEIVGNHAIREKLTALADASAIVGSHATRVVGTIGGNLMNASPAMETGGPLLWVSTSCSKGRVARPRALTSFWKRSAFRSRRPGLAAATRGSSTAARWRSRSSA